MKNKTQTREKINYEDYKKWEIVCGIAEINPDDLEDMEKQHLKNKEMI